MADMTTTQMKRRLGVPIPLRELIEERILEIDVKLQDTLRTLRPGHSVIVPEELFGPVASPFYWYIQQHKDPELTFSLN